LYPESTETMALFT